MSLSSFSQKYNPLDSRNEANKRMEELLGNIIQPKVDKLAEARRKAVGPAMTVASPLETIVDLLLRKSDEPIGQKIKGAIQRGGDIPGALESRGVSPEKAFPIGLAAAMAIPGAGEAKLISDDSAQIATRIGQKLDKTGEIDISEVQKIMDVAKKEGIEIDYKLLRKQAQKGSKSFTNDTVKQLISELRGMVSPDQAKLLGE